MSSSVRAVASLLTLCALGAAVPSPPALAQGVEGTDYRTLAPAQPTTSPGKHEVIEFFSYGCPPCSRF